MAPYLFKESWASPHKTAIDIGAGKTERQTQRHGDTETQTLRREDRETDTET